MAYQELLIQSNQAAPFTPNGVNTCDLTIPGYLSATDLSQSAVVLNMELTDSSNGNVVPLQDAQFKNGYTPKILIKNCRMVSDKAGTLEDIQSSNILTANLQELQQDFETKKSNQYLGQGQPDLPQFGHLVDKFTNQSSKNQTYLTIPLSEIFGMGSMNQFPNQKFGDTKVFLEFEDETQKLNNMFQQVSVSETPCEKLAAAGTTIVVQEALPNDAAIPFYIGQPVLVNSVNAGADNDPVIGTVKSLSVDNSNKLSITVENITKPDGSPATSADKIGAGAISIQGRNQTSDANLRYRINEAQLLLYTVKLSSAQNDSMNQVMKKGAMVTYNTYSLERVNMPQVIANATFDRQFEIEPNCINTMTLIPFPSGSDNPYISRRDNVATYRFNLNGIDTTTRDIEPYKALYMDRLIASSASGNLNLNNLKLRSRHSIDNEKDYFIFPQPVPSVDSFQTLQLHYQQNSTPGKADKILFLFKQVQRQIRLTNQGAQLVN